MLGIDAMGVGKRIGTWAVSKNNVELFAWTSKQGAGYSQVWMGPGLWKLYGLWCDWKQSRMYCQIERDQISCGCCVARVQQKSTDRNHSFSWIWSGRRWQFKLDLQLSKMSRLWEAIKCLIFVTFGCSSMCRKSANITEANAKEDSSFGKGFGSPKGTWGGRRWGWYWDIYRWRWEERCAVWLPGCRRWGWRWLDLREGFSGALVRILSGEQN